MSTEFLWEPDGDGARILRCRGYDGMVEIPERIEGRPVTELGSYVFSDGMRREPEGTWTAGEPGETAPVICGLSLTGLVLPDTLRKIGAYGFYNCEKLEYLSFDSRLTDLGAGLFTGCPNLTRLDVRVREQEKSGLKEILSELRQTVRVWYHGQEEGYLIFPEYFEESVENTPARILWTNTHGCGHRYRYCFQNTQFQFRDYDVLFPHVQVQESEELVCELAMGRIFYPCGLTDGHRKMYETYLREHETAAVRVLLGWEKEGRGGVMGQLNSLLQLAEPGQETLAELVRLAAREHCPEAVSVMTSYSRGRGTAVRKTFEL